MTIYHFDVRATSSPARSLGRPWRDGANRERCKVSEVVLHMERAIDHVGDGLVLALQLRALRLRARLAAPNYWVH